MDDTLRTIGSAWDDELAPAPLTHGDDAGDDRDALRFAMGEPRVDADKLTFTLWVENPGERPARLNTSGFGLMPNSLGVPYIGPPLPAPAPPLPVAITLPPRTKVRYQRSFRLAHYRIDQGSCRYDWTFSDHRSQLLAHGTVEVDLA